MSFRPKTVGLVILCRIFEWQVVRLRGRHKFIVVAVAGSLGKTSTKMALAQLLEHAGKRVQYQNGNYNVRLTVPLVIFGHVLPSLFNVIEWIKIFIRNEHMIRHDYPYDFVVVELGTDAPGQIAQFSYLRPELGIVTAIAPEHMEYFASLDAVADEEFTLAEFAKTLLINQDDIDDRYIPTRDYYSYGLGADSDYRIRAERQTEKGQVVALSTKTNEDFIKVDVAYLGTQGMKIIAGAVAAADILGLNKRQITHALHELRPFAGRMQRLHGIENSIIIDDTYNAAPASVIAALDVLDSIAAPQHIAIIGSMNELGSFTQEAHRMVGAALKSDRVDMVVTIGDDARRYTAPIAAKNGCSVVSFDSPYDAGDYVRAHLQSGAVVLAKGSQNRVFAEEALKPLLKDPSDVNKLVRQSDCWLRKKQQQFHG
jgi:UDP-N-acetylmuramoyl-tripeptide--D-alanyl-D-alanine ligase